MKRVDFGAVMMEHGERLLGTTRQGNKVSIFGRIDGVSKEHTLTCIREWAPLLADRGKIQLWVPEHEGYIELLKRCWKTRPHLLIFRYRNADATREHFEVVRERFDDAGIDYELALTKKAKRPRAIEICLDPFAATTPETALELTAQASSCALDEILTFDVACRGSIPSDPHSGLVDVYIPPEVREAFERWPGGEVSQRMWTKVDRSLRRFAGLPENEE
jgi:hypothetical protein